MKKLLLSALFAFSFFSISYAQCVCTSQYPLGNMTPTTLWSTINTLMYAGDYAVVNVTAGNTYEFSTCSANGSNVTYDSELTLLSDQQQLLAYNDDFCGIQSQLSWVATYTGTVQIHLTEYYLGAGCYTNSTPSSIRYRFTAGALTVPANNLCANATALTPAANCNLTSGTTLGASEDPYPDPSCDMPGVYNDVWYTFNSGAFTSLNLTVNLGTAALIGVEFYSGCGTLATGLSLGGTPGNCDFNTNAPNPTVISGLTPNTTYRMRMFTNASYDTPGTFTACLTTPPPPTVSVNSTSICAGQSVTLTATPSTGGGTYLWSNGATTPTITVTPNATTSYSVTYSNNGTASGSGTVTVNPLPTINGGQDQTVCQGASVTLNGTGGASYTWDNGISNGVAFVANATTTYTVTGTNANGCQGTDQVTVTVNLSPTINVSNLAGGPNLITCAGTVDTIMFFGPTTTLFNWVNSDPSIGLISGSGGIQPMGTALVIFQANNPTLNPITSILSVTPTQAGCTGAPQTFTITVNPNPTITGNNPLCAGATLQLTGSGTAAANNAWVSGTPANGTVSNTGLVTGLNAGNTIITYTNANGCTATQTVTVNASPTISGNTVICPNTTSQLTGTGAPAGNNAWSSSNTGIATVSNNGLVSAVSFGTATITYTASTGCSGTTTVNVTNPTAPAFNPIAAVCSGGLISLPGTSTNNIQGTWTPAVNNTQTTTYTFTPSAGQCATTAQQTVTVNPNPTISGVNSLCPNASIQLTGSGTAAANNAWVSGTPANGTVSNTGLVTGVTAGNTIITYTNANACTATQTVTVHANPSANAGQDQTLCAGGNATLTGTANGGNAPYTYSWNNGVQQGVPFPLNATGTFTLTVTDANGCASTDNVTLTSTSIDWANLQWPATGTVCLGQTHNVYGQIYVAGITNGPGQAAGIIAQVGVNSTNTDPSTWPANAWSNATFNTQAGNNDEFTAGIGNLLSAGTYYYTFRYSLGQGCPYFYGGYNGGAWNGTNNTNGALTINAAPNASSAVNACESYTWYGQTYTQSGTFTHTVPSGAGCDSVLYLNLTIFNNVTGPTIQETACDSYTWNGQTYFQSGTYTFNGSSQNGCDSTATLSLTINNAPSNVQVSLNQGTFTVTAQNASNFAWMDCATNTLIPGETSATFTPTLSGSYAAVVSNACGSDTTTCEPIEVQGISEIDSELISVYPNPSSGIFTVASKESIIQEVFLYSINGELIWRNAHNAQEITIDLGAYARGTYMLRVSTNQQVHIFRLIKQ
jgi:uncharacterized protein YjdB